jgi:methanogenic corrinoid protein MtbC1
LSVAEERLVSETTHRVMAQIAARYQPAVPTGPKVLAAAVTGNAHDLGLRAASDLFALAGWRCLFLGANVPTDDIAAMAEAQAVDLVLLAATLETQLAATAEAIAAIKRSAPACKTLVGGIAADEDAAVLRELGADAHCPRLEDVVALGERLVRGPAS